VSHGTVLESVRYAYVRAMEPPPPELERDRAYFVQHDHPWKRGSRRRPLIRELDTILYLCVHQAAVRVGVNARQIKRAGGDARKALHARILNWPYHTYFFANGDTVDNNPAGRDTQHGGPWNADSYGVCFDGHYPRFADQRTDKHTVLDPERVEDWRQDFGDMVIRLRGLGLSPIIVTHSQSSRKAADPGEELLRDVVCPVAREMNVIIAPDATRGKGRPWPEQWRRHL